MTFERNGQDRPDTDRYCCWNGSGSGSDGSGMEESVYVLFILAVDETVEGLGILDGGRDEMLFVI